MHAPQIILIILIAANGGIMLANDGMPRGNYDFHQWFWAMVVEVAILYWGGFFG